MRFIPPSIGCISRVPCAKQMKCCSKRLIVSHKRCMHGLQADLAITGFRASQMPCVTSEHADVFDTEVGESMKNLKLMQEDGQPTYTQEFACACKSRPAAAGSPVSCCPDFHFPACVSFTPPMKLFCSSVLSETEQDHAAPAALASVPSNARSESGWKVRDHPEVSVRLNAVLLTTALHVPRCSHSQ
jgi:uncharacterized protein YceK